MVQSLHVKSCVTLLICDRNICKNSLMKV